MPDEPKLPPRPTLDDLRKYVHELRTRADEVEQALAMIGGAAPAEPPTAYPEDKPRGKPVDPIVAPPSMLPLTSAQNSVTDETMNARAIVSSPPKVERRRTGPPLNTKGIVGRVATRLNLNLRELAEAIGVNYETVRVWNTRARIPEDGQQKLEKLERDRAQAQKKSSKPAK